MKRHNATRAAALELLAKNGEMRAVDAAPAAAPAAVPALPPPKPAPEHVRQLLARMKRERVAQPC